MKVSNIWDKPGETPANKKPIELLKYISPVCGMTDASYDASNYDNVVRLRGDDDCIVMCWDDEKGDDPHYRDIFTAKWNDGV